MLQKQGNVIDSRYTCYQRSNRSCNFVGMMNRKKFRVLDGPPFANGELHLGHMVNKILKDVCIKANDDLGKSSSIKHNWDCHGSVSYTHLDVYKRQSLYYPINGRFLVSIFNKFKQIIINTD